MEIKTLYPKTDGNYLTQARLEDEENRIFIKRISGVGINEEDWRDATQEEKEEWRRSYIESRNSEI